MQLLLKHLYAIASQTNRSHENPGSLECANFALHLFISRIIFKQHNSYRQVLFRAFEGLLFFRLSKMCGELSMPEN